MADGGLILPAYPFVERQIQQASLGPASSATRAYPGAGELPAGAGARLPHTHSDELKLHEHRR